MFKAIFTTLIVFTATIVVDSQVSLLDQVNYLAGQSQYANQVYTKVQAPFSLENTMGTSLELAVESCQNAFRWEHWNCPTTDFYLRRTSKSSLIDREDAYVNAITTAAVLYTITKNCSSGIIAGCGSCSGNPYSAQCSDDPAAADKLFRKHVNSDFSSDFYGKLSRHNYRVITNLLRKSLVKQCSCSVMGPTGVCIKEICQQILKPFDNIAEDIRHIYEEGLQLSNNPENSRVLWDNIPLDSLVYMIDSPNYCEVDARPHWNGMRGRQCTTGENGENLSEEERLRCNNLCRKCGYNVRPQNVVTETRCNCKFTWGFQVQCEKCVTVQRQYYCY